MKLALISPKGSLLANNRLFRDFWDNSDSLANYRYFWSGTGLGLLIVASLTPASFDIEFVDENIEAIDFNKQYDLVAISAFTQQAMRAYQIANEFRKNGIFVVMGGIHATVMPEEAKNHVDSVIVGEAEDVWGQFIDDFLNGKPKPFYYAKGPTDIAKSPIPKYDVLEHSKYKIVWVQTTRGCPYDCEFCAASRMFGNKYRHRNLDEVTSELHTIKEIWGNPIIMFADDNLFVNKRYSTDLVKSLGRLNVKWFAQTDLSIAKENELLDLLRLNGCIFLFIGFETINEANTEYFTKKGRTFKVHYYQEAIKNIQSRGIGVMGAFIVGFDNDDKSVFEKTTDFIIDSHLYGAQMTILTPLPGTKLRERLEAENRILSNDWSNYTTFDVNFLPKNMSKEELQDGLLTMYQRIYSKEVQLGVANHFKSIAKQRITHGNDRLKSFTHQKTSVGSLL
jgi:radical SAM superfamily enzyme YgiQ (UPF0313 family)